MINIKNQKGMVISSLVGGAIGATASILLTPKKGKEVRKSISTQTGKAVNQIKNMTNSAKGQLSNFKNNTSDKTKNLRNKFSKKNQQSNTDYQDNSETTLRFEPEQQEA